jgi:dTMP kinase
MSHTRGQFITFEGGEGGGKSTNIRFAVEWLKAQGIDVVVTREPGGTPLGESLRELLLGFRHQQMHSDTELLLIFAARAEHIRQVIEPALQAGQWVLCDRFTDASFAYQGGGRGIDSTRIAQLESWVQGELQPNLTLLFDLPIDLGMERVGKRGDKDRFEVEKRAFFERVRACYQQRAEDFSRYRILDASLPLSKVQANLQQILTECVAS